MTESLRFDGLDLARVEEIGLNALQTQRQLFYDGWLLRVSPGKAKRARSVNAHFGSTQAFFYLDRNDFSVTGAPFGTGDGTTTSFQAITSFFRPCKTVC